MTATAFELPMSAPGGETVERLLYRIADNTNKVTRAAQGASTSLDGIGSQRQQSNMQALGEFIGTTGPRMLQFAARVERGVEQLAELAIRAEDNQRALAGLGNAAAQVEQQTNGAVTATQAFNMQQALTRSGLRLSNDELVTLVRGARDHARALGIETPQALQQLTQAIETNNVNGLRQLGFSLHDSHTRGQTLNSTLRLLQGEQRNTAPPTRTMREELDRFRTSMQDGMAAIGSFIATETGLQGFLSRISGSIRDLTRETTEWIDTLNRAPAAQAAEQARLRSTENYAAAVRAARAEAQRLGVNLPAFPGADQVSQSARDALTNRLQSMLRSMQTDNTTFVTTAQGNRVQRSQVIRADGRRGPGSVSTDERDLAVIGAGLRGVDANGPISLIDTTTDEGRDAARRAALSSLGADINREAMGAYTTEQARQARERAARPGANRGPRDSANQGAQADSAAALRAAQLELGVANEANRIMDVRFKLLGQTITREQQLSVLRENASHTEAQANETESARISRIAAARNALAQALAEERDRRNELINLNRNEVGANAQGALGALGAARSGGDLSATQQRQLENFVQIRQQLTQVIASQHQQETEISLQLAAQNLPLSEQLRLRNQLQTVQQSIAQNETTLVAMGQRDRDNARGRIELVQTEFDQWNALYGAAQNARAANEALTNSERESLNRRTQSLQQLTVLERGYRELITQASAEVAAARTEEQRNAALTRRLQLVQRLSQAESQRRNLEREAARDNFAEQAARRINAALDSQATQAERFGQVASNSFTEFSNAFASTMVAVVEGQQDFGQAMAGMLKALLESIAKQSFVEALRSTALGIGHLASQAYPLAALDFAAAAAWGAVGVAAGLGAGAIHTAPPAAANGAASASRAPTTSDRAASGGNGGGLTLNFHIDGALFNEGVATSVVRAMDHAGQLGVIPRGIGLNPSN